MFLNNFIAYSMKKKEDLYPILNPKPLHLQGVDIESPDYQYPGVGQNRIEMTDEEIAQHMGEINNDILAKLNEDPKKKVIQFKVIENTLVLISFSIFLYLTYRIYKYLKTKSIEYAEEQIKKYFILFVIFFLCSAIIDCIYIDWGREGKFFIGHNKKTDIAILSVNLILFAFVVSYLSLLSAGFLLSLKDQAVQKIIVQSALICILSLIGSAVIGCACCEINPGTLKFRRNFTKMISSYFCVNPIPKLIICIIVYSILTILYISFINVLYDNIDNNFIFCILMIILLFSLISLQQETSSLAYVTIIKSPANFKVLVFAAATFKTIFYKLVDIFLTLIMKYLKNQEKQQEKKY